MPRATDVLIGNIAYYDVDNDFIGEQVREGKMVIPLYPAQEPNEGDDVTIYVRGQCWTGKLLRVTPTTYTIERDLSMCIPNTNNEKIVRIRASRPWTVRFYKFGIVTLR